MRLPARLAVAVVALAVAAAGFGAAAFVLGGLEPGSPVAGGNNGSIAFAALDDETWQIYSAEPDGSGLVQLTNIAPPFVVANPAWSPDGSMLAYVVRESDTDRSDIWVINTDGSHARPITDGRGSKRTPAWSPDGTKIAFTNGYDIHVMNADGTNARNLTPGSSNLCASDPTWSPDGGHIAFVGAEVDDDPDGGDIACLGRDVDDDLYVMRSDGGEMHTLFSAPGAQREPTWSPAGSTIVFADHTQAPGSDIGELTLIDSTGTVIGRISDLPEGAQAPTWSSDGRQVAFMANVAGEDHQTIFVMNADGTDVRGVPGLPTDALWPAWQPLSETSEPSLSESSPTSAGPLPRAGPRVTARIPLEANGGISAILYAERSVWVTASFVEGGGGVDASMLFRIDGNTNEVVARIPLGGGPTFVSGGGGLAYGFGSVWVAGYRHGPWQAVAYRVDPLSNSVTAEIPLNGTHGADVALDENSVWVAYFGQDHAGVSRIDPTTDQVVAEIALPSDYVRRITATGGGVVATELEWDGIEGPCTVLTAIDRATSTISARESLGPNCDGAQLFAWNDEIWASSAGLQRVDPVTARLVGEPIPFEPEHSPRSFVLGAGREVWFGAYPGGNGVRPDRIARLDALTGSIEYFIDEGGMDAVFAPETRTIWIIEYGRGITRVDLGA
jgi:Tol biopolymer transport system component